MPVNMAAIASVSLNFHKPISANPNSSNNLSSNEPGRHYWTSPSSISIKPSTKPWLPSRHRILVFNKSNSDPAQPSPNQSQEDQVDNLGVRAALSMLRFYKREISPLIPRSCRYVPTCSEYSMIAYRRYGVVKGTVLTAWRLCRCNPLGGSGFDPPRWFDEKAPIELIEEEEKGDGEF